MATDAGELPAKVSVIRGERSADRAYDRGYEAAGSFVDVINRIRPRGDDFAAGIAAQILRRSKDREVRAWFAEALNGAADLIEGNLEIKVPLLERPGTTARRLREQLARV